MRIRSSYLLFAWCLLTCFSMVATAQTNDRRRFESDVFSQSELLDQRMELAPWRRGSLLAAPLLGLRNSGYDSNVFSTISALEEEDFSLNPEVGIQTYWRISPRWVWANRATYDYLYYFDLDELRGSQFGLESKLYGRFKRLYLEFGSLYRRDTGNPNSETEQRPFYERVISDFSLDYEIMPRGSLHAEANLNDIDIRDTSDPDLLELEHAELSTELSFVYRKNAMFWPSVGVKIRDFDFDSLDNPRDDSQFVRFFVGARNRYKRRTHYNVTIGIEQLNFDTVEDIDDDLLLVRSFAEHRLSRKWFVRGGASQQPIFSVFDPYNFFVSRRIHVGGGYIFSNKTRLGPVVEFGNNDYRNPRTPVDVLREDDLQRFTIEAQFPFQRFYTFNVSFGWLDRDSNIPLQSDEGFQIQTEIRNVRF
ncbi:hypothetical protein SCOR_03985 [Sulfidibacter corallicola]|uniref:Uncharacterized protein n=1 Tax=Sulfidibacter corallicola TaxID=2818388 RepID=A0A8A4TGK7_SULCO|nr:hypothetical protein [Sulfidibacter corallicola]QTD48312.1 hypothetical protein J3U87_22260 [Sulfidibacter corallicola]